MYISLRWVTFWVRDSLNRKRLWTNFLFCALQAIWPVSWSLASTSQSLYLWGPKTYAYRTNDDQTCAKVKGFSLNGSASERLNFEAMKEMLRQEEVVTVTYKDTLKRCKRTLQIAQVLTMNKRCRLTFDKRYIADEQYNTLPYGY